MTLILYYGPGKFGQLPAPSCRKQLCRANSLYLSLLSSFLTWTLKNEKMHARAMLIVFLTFASFASVHVSLTHVTGPLTWTLKQVFFEQYSANMDIHSKIFGLLTASMLVELHRF